MEGETKTWGWTENTFSKKEGAFKNKIKKEGGQRAQSKTCKICLYIVYRGFGEINVEKQFQNKKKEGGTRAL